MYTIHNSKKAWPAWPDKMQELYEIYKYLTLEEAIVIMLF